MIGGPNDGYSEMDVSSEHLLQSGDDHIATSVDITFPMFRNREVDHRFFQSHAILAPTLDVVDCINKCMSDLNDAEGKNYLSCDIVCKSNSNANMLSDLHTLKFLNGLRCSGVPNH